ncbi:MAG: hypothetical protein OXE52_10425 [Chloroflexi bacterium]|nr:hypothetical protein [Chloroflexota bacterium]
MRRLTLCLAAICVIWVCHITSAQDRGFASAIEWSPDGETIAIASTKGLWFFDAQFNELGYVEIEQGKYDMSPRSLSWNATGDLVAIGFPMYVEVDKQIQVIDVDKLEVITEIVNHLLWTQVEWHPTDNLLAAGSWSGEAHVWDALTGKALFEFEESAERHINGYTRTRNSTLAVCWFTESVIAIVTLYETYLVDVELNKTLQSFDIRTVSNPVDCTGDYKIFAGSHEIVDLKTGTSVAIPNRNEINRAESLFPDVKSSVINEQDGEFSPDGSKYLIIEEGCLLHIHDGNDGKSLTSVRGGMYFVQEPYTPFADSLAWHPDGSRFAAVGQFGGIRIWDGETYDLLQRFDGFEAGYGEISFRLNFYSEESLNQIEAFKKKCIKALNVEL